jgi:hypothetical protein
LLDEITVMPITRGAYGRRMTLIARQGSLGTAPEVVTSECRAILREEVFPKITEKLPWLAESLHTGDD